MECTQSGAFSHLHQQLVVVCQAGALEWLDSQLMQALIEPPTTSSSALVIVCLAIHTL